MLRLAFPIILSFWMRSLFTFVDTVYASFLSDEALAAIGVAIPLEFLMIAVWVGLSTGLTSYLSRSVGVGDTARFDQLLRMMKKIIAVVSAGFFLLGIAVWFFADKMGLDPEVQRQFAIYGSVLTLGTAFTSFWSILPDSIIKAHHDTKSTMMAGIFSNVTNVILNTLFLFVFHWGIFGIALSTGIGRVAGLLYALWRARKLEGARRQAFQKGGRVDSPLLERPLRGLSKLMLPAGLAYVLMASEAGAVNWMLSRFPDSTSAIAVYGVFFRVFLFFGMPMIAVTVAQLPFVARYAAQGKIQLIRQSYRSALGYSVIYVVAVVGPLCYFFADSLMRFLMHTETAQAMGPFAIHVVPLFCLASTPFMLSRSIFEGFQRGGPTVWMAVLRYGVLAMPLAFTGLYLAPRYGVDAFEGLMGGLLVATLVASGVYYLWTKRFLACDPCLEQASQDMT